MLEDYKKIYLQVASFIPDWKIKSKSDLIRSYVKYKEENNKELSNAYISAIILKYWGTLNNNYFKKPHNSKITIEDCYDWLINAIWTVTKRPVFDDEYLILKYKDGHIRKNPNKLYGKPNSPDLCMIKCLDSMRAGFYQKINYDVRKVNYEESLSLENLIESKMDCLLPTSNTDIAEEKYFNSKINNLINSLFKNKLYDEAFILEGIINGDVFDIENGKNIFNKKKLIKHLRHLGGDYISILTSQFQMDEMIIKKISKKYTRMKLDLLNNNVDSCLNNLKNNTKLKSILGLI